MIISSKFVGIEHFIVQLARNNAKESISPRCEVLISSETLPCPYKIESMWVHSPHWWVREVKTSYLISEGKSEFLILVIKGPGIIVLNYQSSMDSCWCTKTGRWNLQKIVSACAWFKLLDDVKENVSVCFDALKQS